MAREDRDGGRGAAVLTPVSSSSRCGRCRRLTPRLGVCAQRVPFGRNRTEKKLNSLVRFHPRALNTRDVPGVVCALCSGAAHPPRAFAVFRLSSCVHAIAFRRGAWPGAARSGSCRGPLRRVLVCRTTAFRPAGTRGCSRLRQPHITPSSKGNANRSSLRER
jgi:hypothetical protein